MNSSQIIHNREKGTDQEPIQSNSTSCPKHRTGKGHLQIKMALKDKQHKWKAKGTGLSQQMA